MLRTLPAVLVLLALACASSGCRRTQQPDNVSPLAGIEDDPSFSGRTPSIAPATHVAAGRLAESRGDWAGAAQQYRQALAKQPRQREAMYRLGVVLSRVRDREAIEVWKRYIALTNNSAEGWGNLGLCYELLGEFPLAEEAYQQGIARNARSATCRVNYGMFLAARGQHDAAVEQFAAVLPPAQGWYNVGSVCEQQGRKDEAIAAYRRALEIDPELIVAQRRLSVLLAEPPATQQTVTSTE